MLPLPQAFPFLLVQGQVLSELELPYGWHSPRFFHFLPTVCWLRGRGDVGHLRACCTDKGMRPALRRQGGPAQLCPPKGLTDLVMPHQAVRSAGELTRPFLPATVQLCVAEPDTQTILVSFAVFCP